MGAIAPYGSMGIVVRFQPMDISGKRARATPVQDMFQEMTITQVKGQLRHKTLCRWWALTHNLYTAGLRGVRDGPAAAAKADWGGALSSFVALADRSARESRLVLAFTLAHHQMCSGGRLACRQVSLLGSVHKTTNVNSSSS